MCNFKILPVGFLVGVSSILLVLSGCNNVQKNEPIENKERFYTSSFVSKISIYFLETDTISVTDFITEAKKTLPDFSLIEDYTETKQLDGYAVKLITKIEGEYMPPDTSYLNHIGRDLTSLQKKKLQKAKRALSIIFRGSDKNILDKQYRIAKLIQAVTSEKNVIIAEYNTIEFFNPISWKAYRVDNFEGNDKDITGQIIIRMVHTGAYCRAVTLGMDKFCLPDITVKEYTCNESGSMGYLINLIAQTFSENRTIAIDSALTLDVDKIQNAAVRKSIKSAYKNAATGLATIRVKNVIPENQDNLNRQLQIIFEMSSTISMQEAQKQTLSKLLGTKDEIFYTEHSAEVIAASNRAKQKLERIKLRFLSGNIMSGNLYVKALLLSPSNKREWMWINVHNWDHNNIQGIVQSDSSTPTIKSGESVTVDVSQVFDYIIYKNDGTYEGNETEKLLTKQSH